MEECIFELEEQRLRIDFVRFWLDYFLTEKKRKKRKIDRYVKKNLVIIYRKMLHVLRLIHEFVLSEE